MKFMRDVLIENIHRRMSSERTIFFLTADLGAPSLDMLRKDFPDRCINVGIAEQNLIAVSTGLALEGFKVFVYGIAPFITMRAYEQMRINLSLLSHTREMNVNIISVGVGFSYDVSGPTHHCVEDLTIIRLLPNVTFFSPSDTFLVEHFVDYSLSQKKPKYLRLDGKLHPQLYHDKGKIDFDTGFCEIRKGDDICIVSTGCMTHKAITVAEELSSENISVGIIDVFMICPINEEKLGSILNNYKNIITIEESFIERGGLDSLISCILNKSRNRTNIMKFGLSSKYIFDNGGREYLHRAYNMDNETIMNAIRDMA